MHCLVVFVCIFFLQAAGRNLGFRTAWETWKTSSSKTPYQQRTRMVPKEATYHHTIGSLSTYALSTCTIYKFIYGSIFINKYIYIYYIYIFISYISLPSHTSTPKSLKNHPKLSKLPSPPWGSAPVVPPFEVRVLNDRPEPAPHLGEKTGIQPVGSHFGKFFVVPT